MPIRVPIPELRPFVDAIWVSDQSRSDQSQSDQFQSVSMTPFREYALPSGGMGLVVRLSDMPIVLCDADRTESRSYGYTVVSGARSGYYARELAGPVRSIGASLRAGATERLFGIPADEFAERHIRLEDVWGHQAQALRERVLEAQTYERQLDAFESFLKQRLRTIKGMHPAIAQALALMKPNTDIELLAKRSGYSHRRFIELFRRSVGLTPKLYSRVQRFQRTLKAISQSDAAAFAQIAFDMGYSDQSHFNREFREFAGMTPAEYKQSAPLSPSHVRRDARR